MSDERKNYDEVMDLIITAWHNGRTIVPLFGAGCSYDAGMPVVTGIQRYLYKFRCYLDKYLLMGASDILTDSRLRNSLFIKFLHKKLDLFKRTPSTFLHIFGWPGRFDIHAEIAATLSEYDVVEDRINKAKERIIASSRHRYQANRLKLCLDVYKQNKPNEPQYDFNYDINWYLEDWRDTISHFTDHDADLADALFSRLHIDRPPALAHQYAAFLTRLNVWTILLTFNFDQYFEIALRQQDIPHRVFALEEGMQFPGELLTRNTTAVLKLHGDTHRLLLDYRLEEPLTRDYLKRLQQCLQGRGSMPPLLVVLGCSGADRRVRSVVEHFANQKKQEELKTVAWIHFDKEAPDFFREDGIGSSVSACRALNPGYFLKALYGRMAGRYPASRVPYLTHSERPFGFDSGETGLKVRKKVLDQIKDQPFAVINGFDPAATHVVGCFPAEATASQHLAEFLRVHSGIHHVIWVDLEACYSLADVIVMIVDQAKRYDTATTPFAMGQDSVKPNQDGSCCNLDIDRNPLSDEVVDRAVQRVLRILQRAHFLLAFDGLETLTWPPTAHHGDVEKTRVYMGTHLKDVMAFFKRLASHRAKFHGSRVVISIDTPHPRHAPGLICPPCLDQGLIEKLKSDKAWIDLTTNSTVTVKDLLDDIGSNPNRDQAVFRLSCFRRTRNLVEIRQAFVDDANRCKDVIDACCIENRLLFHVEGDGLWMNRSRRNAIYSHFTNHTSQVRMDEVVRNEPNDDHPSGELARKNKFGEAVRQTFRAFTEHDCIATTYFETYLASKDAAAFFEYVYHRVSSIRYLSKTCVLVGVDCGAAQQALVKDDWTLRKNPNYGDDVGGMLWKDFFANTEDLSKQLAAVLQARYEFLLDAWRQSADSLRYQAPAGQIIFWVRWLLSDDFDRMFPEKLAGKIAGSQSAKLVLQRFLLELWGESAFERMDFYSAAAVFQDLERLEETSERKGRASLACQRALAYASAFSGDLDYQSAGSGISIDDKPGKLSLEARLWKMSAALAALETPIYTGDGKRIIHVTDAIKELRFRNTSAKYFQYASQHHVENDDLRIANMWIYIQDARLSAMQTSLGDSDNWQEIYKKIDLARALASDSAAHRQGIVELFAGVIVRQHIERLIFVTAPLPNLHFAIVKVRSLRSILDRARAHLRRGRRNTRWWRLYYRLEIRWALWEIIAIRWQIHLSNTESADRQRETLGLTPALAKLHETVRIAAAAIRSRLDLDLNHCANSYLQFHEQFPSLEQWWLAIRDVSILTSQEIACAFGDQIKFDLVDVQTVACEVFDSISKLCGVPVPGNRVPSRPLQSDLSMNLSWSDDRLYNIIQPLIVPYDIITGTTTTSYFSLVDPG
ncbi:SIR2 family protein [Fimbriiglobus ruber]|uniref:Uncharacterized protein n=1 Tax=Fimbriiglobus ruber TaxID=1908690 RepID=A0A225E3Z4_9BACT|nr:SIR2 family protein [Fimbriiglobus ruber]OWK46474.1 hypothetical protein FRUB_00173 [Fimbriiglobus ruber]